MGFISITVPSKIIPEIYITVYVNSSGGYFSKSDLYPEPLASLVKDQETRNKLNQEYEFILSLAKDKRLEYLHYHGYTKSTQIWRNKWD